jgi:hypothetical protein
MSITYEYRIGNLEYTNDDSKAVLIAHYDVRASDPDLGEQTVRSYGTVSFSPDPNASDFVPFEELTEDTVLGWIKGELDTDSIEATLASKLEEANAPKTASGLPWINSTDDTTP